MAGDIKTSINDHVVKSYLVIKVGTYRVLSGKMMTRNRVLIADPPLVESTLE